MKSTQISLVQMQISYGRKDENLEKTTEMIERAISQAVPGVPHIVCLPELFSTGYDLKNAKLHAETIPEGRTTKFLQQTAIDHSIVLLASYIECWNEKYYNTAVVIDTNGILVGKYRKIHLFPIPIGTGNPPETTVFSIGEFYKSKTSFKTQSVNLGLLICFDLRFPEISRRIVLEGKVDLLVYLAEFPHPRCAIWKRLLQARAMENQIFVCGVNSVGSDFNFCGGSVAYDPYGNVLIEGSAEKEEILTTQLDPSLLKEVRTSLPSLKYRQPNYY
ncbi:MAG: hypothetical protein JSV04_09855 [Candidatus Heimdallarchaeota archaeon]|nr:MAG: hypothetical protein JSV04_09855 [Candidatus Heimdallarchaeota archaeon]